MSDLEEISNSQSDGESLGVSYSNSLFGGEQIELFSRNGRLDRPVEMHNNIKKHDLLLKQESTKSLRDPNLRRRATTFAQNHQFTVSAAEFLNLASRDELNKLYTAGYDADSIEQLLERKYRKKQRFWYASGVSRHKYKRKNFNTWIRSMDDASIFNSNTILDEDQLMKQLDSNETRRLKEINDIPLNEFDDGISTPSDDDSDNQDEESTKSTIVHNIPTSERSVVELNTTGDLEDNLDPDSQIMVPSKTRTVPNILEESQFDEFKEVNNHDSDSQSEVNLTQDSFGDHPHPQSETSEQLLNNIFDEVSNIESITAMSPLKRPTVDISNVQSSPTPVQHEIDGIKINTIAQTLIAKEPAQGRQLRHRNIVNRNPYMVDRAEYLGLSTPFELSDMAESGKTDDEIIAYLDSVYQKRRAKRKESGYDYGPFSKATFKEVMELPLASGRQSHEEAITQAGDDDFETQNQTDDGDDDDNNPSIDGEFDDTFDMFDDQFVTKRKRREFESVYNKETQRSDDELAQPDPFQKSMDHIRNYMTGSAVEDKRSFVNPLLHRSAPVAQKLTTKRKHKLEDNQASNNNASTNVKNITYTSRKIPTTQQDVYSFTKSYKAFNDPLLELAFSDNEDDDQQKKQNQKATGGDNDYEISTKRLKTKNTSTGMPTLNRSNTGLQDDNKVSGSSKSMSTTLKVPPGLSRSKSMMTLKRPNEFSSRENPSPGSDIDETKEKSRKKIKKSNNIIAASFAPKTNSKFEFNRDVIKGSFQAEGISAFFRPADKEANSDTRFNADAARGVNVIKESRISGIADNENWKTIRRLWHGYQDETDSNERRMKVLLDLKPEHFAEFETSSKLLASSLIKNVLNINATYYHKSNIMFELDKSSNMIPVPLNSVSNILKSVKDFFTFLAVALRGGKLSNQRLVQIRKSLINIIRLFWNLKKDLPETLVDVGLLINEFMNSLRDHPPDHESFCFFSPFLLVCMFLLQRFLGPHSNHYTTFQKSARWIQKRFMLNFCQIQYQLFYIPENKVYFEALNLFLMFSKNPWDLVTQLAVKLNPIDVTCALYFMSQTERIETDWAFYIQHLARLENLKKENLNDIKSDQQAKELCALIIKLNRDLSWDLDPQVLVKVFRLLSAHRFINVGTIKKSRATIYPHSEPQTLVFMPEDGCLDLYFKMLSIFAQSYIKNYTSNGYQLSFLETDLTPGSTLNGYTAIQLQNRAKVVLMLWIVFDKDVLAYLTNIIEVMLKEGSVYSSKTLIALLRLLTTRISRKPIVTSLKFLPQIIENINKAQNDNELNLEFKELLLSVKNNITSDEQLPLKYSIQCMLYLMKLENLDPFEECIKSIFETITENWMFASQIANDKDHQKINKLLDKLANVSRKKLIDKTISLSLKNEFLKYWMFSRIKLNMNASKIYYQEWLNIGSEKIKQRLELSFFSYLVEVSSVIDIKGEVIACFYKYLANDKSDMRRLIKGVQQLGILPVDLSKFCHLTSEEFIKRRTDFTVRSLSVLVGKYTADDFTKNIMNTFIISLKTRYETEIDSQFIRDVSTYLYTVIGDEISLPEWKYLEAKLKLETVTGSLSKQIAYASDISTNRLITSIVKSYIAAIINGELAVFTNDFKHLFTTTESSQKLVTSVCNILSFHINSIKHGNWEFEWIHVNFWLKIMLSMLEYSWLKLDYISIIAILKESSTLSAYYAKATACIYYYHDSVRVIYCIIRMLSNQLQGFLEGKELKRDIKLFAGMDSKFINEFEYYPGVLIENETNDILNKAYHDNSLLLNGKYYLVQNQQVIFEMSEKVDKERKETYSYLQNS